MAKRTAIIDIGSNSVRMIVVERTSRFGFYLINESKSRVRISEGAYENGGNLQPFAIERAIKALREFLHIAKALKVKKILCVATSAVRDAPNRHIFLSRAKKELALHIKVIDGEREALFGAIAALNLLPISDGVTLDIGGGSSELALIKDRKILQTLSLDLGTVRLKELFFDKEKNIEKALRYIHNQLATLPPQFSSKLLIGIGGTARAIAQAIMKKEEYPLDKLHGFSFDFSKEKKFIDKIITAPVYKLKKLGIKKDRYDTIKEGALIFREISKHLGVKEIITSGAGVREGVFLYDLLRNCHYTFPHNFNPSLKSLLDRFCIDEKQSICHYKLSKKLYEALFNEFDKKRAYEKVLLIAAKLLNIGTMIDFYEHHKHSSYIALNDLEYGFTHQEIATIAILVRFHKKKLPNKEEIAQLSALLPSKSILEWLSFILALAETLNRDLSCPDIQVTFTKNLLQISSSHPLYLAQEEIKNLQKPKAFAIQFV